MEKIKFISEKPNNWNVSIGSQALSLLKRKGIEDEQKDSILKIPGIKKYKPINTLPVR